jgi:hypothetical protein
MDLDVNWPDLELTEFSSSSARVAVSGAVGVECSGIYRYSTAAGCELECVLGVRAEVEVEGDILLCPGGVDGKLRMGNYDVDIFGSVGVRFGSFGSVGFRADGDGNWSAQGGICLGF